MASMALKVSLAQQGLLEQRDLRAEQDLRGLLVPQAPPEQLDPRGRQVQPGAPVERARRVLPGQMDWTELMEQREPQAPREVPGLQEPLAVPASLEPQGLRERRVLLGQLAPRGAQAELALPVPRGQRDKPETTASTGRLGQPALLVRLAQRVRRALRVEQALLE